MEQARKGEIEYAMCLGGNLLGSNPDTKFAMNAMSKFLSFRICQRH